MTDEKKPAKLSDEEQRKADIAWKAKVTRDENAKKAKDAETAAKAKATREQHAHEAEAEELEEERVATEKARLADAQRLSDGIASGPLESPEEPFSPWQDPSYDTGVATPVVPRVDTGQLRSPVSR